MKVHPVQVDGFDGALKTLARRVCKLRFDQLVLFFGYCAVELIDQSNADMKRGRKQLGILLTALAGMVSAVQSKTEEVFRLSLPYIRDEFMEGEMSDWEEALLRTKWWMKK